MENKIIKAGTKIVMGVYAGSAGTDSMTAYILTQDYTEDELSDMAWQEGGTVGRILRCIPYD